MEVREHVTALGKVPTAYFHLHFKVHWVKAVGKTFLYEILICLKDVRTNAVCAHKRQQM